jgi:hypothetical protein
MSQDLEAAAHTLGLQLHILPASTEQDFDAVFARLAALKAEGLVIAPDAFFITRSEQLAALTVRREPETLPMLRFACLVAVIVLTSGSVEAQTKKGAKSADSYRRAECYRELGYTRAQARKPTKAAIEAVDQCLARRRANPAAAPQGEPED